MNRHLTVQDPDWRLEHVESSGFNRQPDLVTHFSQDKWIRGEENAPNSFHLILESKWVKAGIIDIV